VDHSLLRGRIRAVFGTQEAFAKAMLMSPCSLSKKLNGKTEWAADEIRRACDLLRIPIEEIPIYFFCPMC
jgi:transcriptional regulator with XRE-family HTH domain